MPEQKKPKHDKNLSLYPMPLEDALKKIVTAKPPPKKEKPATKQQPPSTNKQTE